MILSHTTLFFELAPIIVLVSSALGLAFGVASVRDALQAHRVAKSRATHTEHGAASAVRLAGMHYAWASLRTQVIRVTELGLFLTAALGSIFIFDDETRRLVVVTALVVLVLLLMAGFLLDRLDNKKIVTYLTQSGDDEKKPEEE